MEASINKKYSSQEIAQIIEAGIKKSEIRRFFMQPGNLPYSEVKKYRQNFVDLLDFVFCLEVLKI